ncbi:MAG: hypothetical protein ACRDXE_01640 [Acidimicrobiales bacterium]
MATEVRIFETAIAEFLRAPEGPVGRRMMVYGEAVKQKVVEKLKPGFPRDFLAPNIVKRTVASDSGPIVTVGAARLKTQPHRIDGNPLLVFHWPKAGGTVFFRHVNHPGSDFTRYVTEKLQEALTEVMAEGRL